MLCAGVTGFSFGNDSVEYELGSNPSGEIERLVLSTCKAEVTCEFGSIGEGEMESGDIAGAMLEGSSLNGLGDASSGFAMRKPPRDWERLKSPSMAGVPKATKCDELVLVRRGFVGKKIAVDASNVVMPSRSAM